MVVSRPAPATPLTSLVLAGVFVLALASCGGSSATGSARADASSSDVALPFTIGQGFAPGVAVDPDGTAFIAWYGPETTTNTLRFCRLPRDARACDVESTIAAPGTTLTRPFVTVEGTRVRVVSYRYGLTGDRFDAVHVFTSNDRGATFDGGRAIGSVPFDDAAVGPGDAISLATDAYSFGEVYERAPFDGTKPPTERAILSADHPYSGSVALIDGTTPLVVFADADGNAQFRRHDGAGDPNDETSWGPAEDLGVEEYMDLAAGQTGLFLKGRTAANTLEIRRFDGATFAPGVSVPEGTGELPQSHLSQDPAGRLHAVWPRIDVDGTRLYHASSDDGASWRSDLLVTGPEEIASMRVAAAADHRGVTVWAGPEAAIVVLPIGVAE